MAAAELPAVALPVLMVLSERQGLEGLNGAALPSCLVPCCPVPCVWSAGGGWKAERGQAGQQREKGVKTDGSGRQRGRRYATVWVRQSCVQAAGRLSSNDRRRMG
jgi:hypothetical protein